MEAIAAKCKNSFKTQSSTNLVSYPEMNNQSTATSSSSSPKNDTVSPLATCFALINEDLLHSIISKLTATSFASAACVNKSWNRICKRVLSRPKLASALSLDPSPHVLYFFLYSIPLLLCLFPEKSIKA